MSKNAILYVFLLITTLSIKLTHGNIFTDPTKLACLFDFQLRLSKILYTVNDEELAKVPRDVVIGLFR